MALPAEHASSHQAWCLLPSMNQLLFLFIREGSSVDRVRLILSYLMIVVFVVAVSSGRW